MIDLSPALPPLIPAAPVLAASGDGVVVPGAKFSETLDNFLDASAASVESQAATPALPERQAAAEPGKDLPPAKDKERDPTDTTILNPWVAAPALPASLPALKLLPEAAATREPGVKAVAILQSAAPATAPGPIAPVADRTLLPLDSSVIVSGATPPPTPAVVQTPAPFPADQSALPAQAPDRAAAQSPLTQALAVAETPRPPLAPPPAATALPSPRPSPAQPAPPADPQALRAVKRAADQPPLPRAQSQSEATTPPPVLTAAALTDPAAAPLVPAATVQTPGAPTLAPVPVLVGATLAGDGPRVSPPVIVLPPAQPDAAAAAIAISALPQPAGQVFASARAIAGSWHDRAARRDASDLIELPTAFAAASLELRERAVHAAGQPASTALDLTRDSGLQQMIDRIETLRDAADAGDTRVRLIPDALGSIDVAVRQDGDRVHVRFTAEQDATRALIAEAQPRLTELAAARGVRIGETSVSTGGGGGNATPQPRPAPSRARVAATAASVSPSTPDHRLA